MGRVRRLAATASLLASAGGFFWLSVMHGGPVTWQGIAFGAGLAGASVGIVRKNVFAQILSRGLTWVLFAPCAAVIAVEILKGHLMEGGITAFGLASGLALFLSRPMLDSDEARAAFAPSKFRRSFLAACTAAVTTGLVTGIVAWQLLWESHVLSGLGLAALGTSMLASAFGVLRMRGWGIALAVLNGIISLVAGAATGSAEGVVLAATALPAVLFLTPIAFAKLGLGGEDARSTSSAARIRVADEEALPARVRIDVDEDELGLDEPAAVRERRVA